MADVTVSYVDDPTPVYIPPTSTNPMTSQVTNPDGTVTVIFADNSTSTFTDTSLDTEVSFTPAPADTIGSGSNTGASTASASISDVANGSSNSNGTNNVNNTSSDISNSNGNSNSNNGNSTGDNGFGIGAGSKNNLLSSSLVSPVPTDIIPNPLHQYASSTYALSLWWLDVHDLNGLTNAETADIGTGTNYQLGALSYVVAEDSGLYPQRRLPTQVGLNYNIQDVNIETVVGLNSKSKSSNMITGSMTIVEPYGVTFLDSLVRASGMAGSYQNYTEQPFMLQIDFTGYDDAGDPIPSSETSIYRKRFPIRIIGMKIEVTSKGAEYKLDFVPMGHIAYLGGSSGSSEYSTVPKDLTINASTVQGFFDAFTNALDAFWRLESLEKKTEYSDSITFKIDPNIATSTIVYDKQMSIAQANPNSKQIDLSKGNFSIPAGTQIQEVINRILQQSSYIIGQLGLDKQNTASKEVQTSLTQILNTYKTTIQVSYIGTNTSGATVNGAFDNIRNVYAKQLNYSISQYHVYDAVHPAAPTLSDARPYIIKQYNYLYTGQNNDITDLKINFDTTFYTAVNSYTNQVASTETTASTSVDTILGTSTSLLLSPQLLGALNVIPGLNQIPNLTPNKYKNIVNDQRDNIGFNTIKNPASQTAANVMRSIYSGDAKMINVELSILGDPTLIKQDDWLYTPNPRSTNNIFNQFLSQFDLAKKYGQIKMDGGELVVSLKVNTPIDIDTDWTNKGLVFPAPGTVPSLFSGLYGVTIIKNSFSGGVFTQVLNLYRLSNSDIITSSAPADATNGRDTTTTTQTNLNSANQTVAGQANSKLGTSAVPTDSASTLSAGEQIVYTR